MLHSSRARNNGRNVIAVRGELIPYIDLRRAFRIESEAPPVEKVVIVRLKISASASLSIAFSARIRR